MFDVRRARGLHALAQHGTVGAAAEALHMTSSALSQQLAKLEGEIGQPLLVRRGRGVALTDAGRLLVRHTARILEQITQAEAELQAQRCEVSGRMAIAAIATATRGFLPAALRSLQDQHPLLSVESHEREPAKAVPLLVRGAVDVIILDEWFYDEPVPPPGVEITHLLDDVADLALPAGHELASAGAAVDLSSCAHEQWISWSAGEFGHDWLRAALIEHHPGLRLAHTAGEHQTILALVAAGLGLALMPRLGRGPVPQGVEIRELRPPITRRLFALWRTDTAQRPAIGAAVDALTAAARETASRPGHG